jgi:hypothetical protein
LAVAVEGSLALGFTSSADCEAGLILESSPERRSNVAISVSIDGHGQTRIRQDAPARPSPEFPWCSMIPSTPGHAP